MDTPSNREKKRTIASDLRRLRNTPGWDPTAHTRPSPEDQLRTLGDESRRDRVYDGTAECAECASERKTTGDETALCETHLMEAMGL